VFNGQSFGGFVHAFTPIASFDFSLAARAAGLTLNEVLESGGLFNWANGLLNPKVNTSGIDYNNPNNPPNYQIGSNYFDSYVANVGCPGLVAIPTTSVYGLIGGDSITFTSGPLSGSTLLVNNDFSGNLEVTYHSADGNSNPIIRQTWAYATSRLEYLADATAPQSFIVPLGEQGGISATIHDSYGNGLVEVDVGGLITPLGSGLKQNGNNEWEDTNGIQYQFVATDPAGALGTLKVFGGIIGAGNEIDIQDFDLSRAEDPNSQTGFLGIKIPDGVAFSVNGIRSSSQAHVARAVQPQVLPSLSMSSGGESTFSISLGAPATTAQTVAITLQGGTASDFALIDASGNLINFNGNNATITIPAGQSSLTLSLANTTDVGSSANLSLSASIKDANGSVVASTQNPLSVT
jgi:hypothetical protein